MEGNNSFGGKVYHKQNFYLFYKTIPERFGSLHSSGILLSGSPNVYKY